MSDQTPADQQLRGRGRIYSSITDTMGDTPIVRLDRLASVHGVGAHLLAKLEFFMAPVKP